MPERMVGPALVLVVLVVLVGYLLGVSSIETAPAYRPSPSPQVSATTDPDGDRP